MLVGVITVGADAGLVRDVCGLAGGATVGPTIWVGVGSAFAWQQTNSSRPQQIPCCQADVLWSDMTRCVQEPACYWYKRRCLERRAVELISRTEAKHQISGLPVMAALLAEFLGNRAITYNQLGDTHTEVVIKHEDFAPRNEAAIHIDIDGIASELIQSYNGPLFQL